MQKLVEGVDLYVAPSFQGDNLLLTNLTGHPCVVLPNGFSKEGTPTSITFMGKLFDEARLLAVAKKYQDATGYHLRHPKLPD
jgi:Asp-tRNA(Asn)/Glu-tRNA(Gln) amidotransferase A subunit family amidase